MGIGYYDGKNNYFINPDLLNSKTFKKYLKDEKVNKLTYDFKAS